MGKRGPAPKGDFQQSVMLTCRVQPDTLARLNRAAGLRSRSQEVERRLRDSFIEEDKRGDPETVAFLEYLNAVIQTIGRIKKPEARWFNDLYLFEQTRQALIDGIELFRPEGAPLTNEEIRDAGGSAQGRVAARETIREMQIADPALSLTRGSKRQHVLGRLRYQLGPIAERLRPWGRTAEQERQLHAIGSEINPLRQKLRLAETGRGPSLSDAEARQLEELTAQLLDTLAAEGESR
jgi:hypothetical protein